METEVPKPSRDYLRTTALVLFVVIAVVFVLVQWRPILVPIAIAIVIWYIILALSGVFARVRIGGNTLPQIGCRTAAIACVFTAALVFVELIRESVRALQVAAPRYEERLDAFLTDMSTWLSLEDAPTFAQIAQDIDLRSVAQYFMSSATSVVFDMIMIFFYVLFLIIQQKWMMVKLGAIVRDPGRRQTVDQIIEKIHKEVQKYIGVMSFLALVTGGITYLILKVVGIEFAILWAVIIGLFSFIPTIGTAFGIALPALLALMQFGASSEFVIVLLTLGAAQILLNNVAQPTLMGKSLNLSPFIILVALSAWGTIWGVVGAVLSIPITVAMAIIFSHFPSTRWVAVLLSSRVGTSESS